MDKKLFQQLHDHAVTLERLLVEHPDLPLADVIRDLRAAAEFILVASTLVVLWVLSWLSTRARFGSG